MLCSGRCLEYELFMILVVKSYFCVLLVYGQPCVLLGAYCTVQGLMQFSFTEMGLFILGLSFPQLQKSVLIYNLFKM